MKERPCDPRRAALPEWPLILADLNGRCTNGAGNTQNRDAVIDAAYVDEQSAHTIRRSCACNELLQPHFEPVRSMWAHHPARPLPGSPIPRGSRWAFSRPTSVLMSSNGKSSSHIGIRKC